VLRTWVTRILARFRACPCCKVLAGSQDGKGKGRSKPGVGLQEEWYLVAFGLRTCYTFAQESSACNTVAGGEQRLAWICTDGIAVCVGEQQNARQEFGLDMEVYG
jgi:hypothetical protein